MDTKEEFLAFVSPEPNTSCWLWDGPYTNGGYGSTQWVGKKELAHRLSYKLFIGPLPTGLCILHTCHVRCCVNPRHLRVGTQSENIKEAYKKGTMVKQGRGEKANNSKLTERLVREIKFGSRKDWDAKNLALLCNVSRATIYDIRNNRSWSHIVEQFANPDKEESQV